jgi:hypothetical protein
MLTGLPADGIAKLEGIVDTQPSQSPLSRRRGARRDGEDRS